MRFCLRRLSAQKPQETRAPTASGRRSPKLSLSDPSAQHPPPGRRGDHAVERHDAAAHADVDCGLKQGLRAMR